MNYKRFSRFFCLAAACCVILAGAAAPLTAYAAEDDGSAALDVAQETMTLAAGVYRWNDILTVPQDVSFPLEIYLDFSVSPSYELVDSEIVLSGSYDASSLMINLVDSQVMLVYYRDGSEAAIPYMDELLWNATAVMAGELGIANASVLNGWGQTISIPYAQEVPADFGELFTANAVKQVSPMETFLDNFTAPISGIWSVVTDVSDTIVSTPLLLLAFCFAFLGMCVSIFGRILSRS